MKRLFLCFLISFSLTGCFSEEEAMSAIDYVRQGENQMRHYRPVHRLHKDWSIAESGKTLTVRSDTENIRLSVRTNERIVIRKQGNIVANIEKTQEGAKLTFASDSTTQKPLEVICVQSHIVETRYDGLSKQYRIDENGDASSATMLVKKIQGTKHRYSIAPKDAQAAVNDSCKGEELESPFSSVGTLVFHDDEIPLWARSGLAWFLTKIQSECDL